MTPAEYIKIANAAIAEATRSVLKKKLAGLALVVALVTAIAAASAYVKEKYLPQVVTPPAPTQSQPTDQQSQPSEATAVVLPRIQTSVTKNEEEWMGKYCREQAALLPPAPFKYESKDTYERAKWIPIPPRYVASRMPKDAKGNKPDSMSCGMVYKYDEKEAFASVGVLYEFDINASNEFYRRADQIHTSTMDATWKKISPLSNEEADRPFFIDESFPLLFMRENPALGTVEYADMSFAVDYYVKFTVYEKPR